MEHVPLDIIIIIFSHIEKITDKRQFTRTCITYNNSTKKLIEIAESEIKIKTKIKENSKYLKYTKKYSVEKFTLELCNDSYFNLIPMSYLNPKNNIIIIASAIYGQEKLFKLAMKNGCDIDITKKKRNVCDFAAIGGNLNILKIARLNGCEWREKTFELAAQSNNFHIMSELSNGFTIFFHLSYRFH